MNERIKELRKSLNLTQQSFADRLNISRDNIAGYETGKRSPSVAVVALICREFNVNENWLRFGDGEMFTQPLDYVASIVANVLEYDPSKDHDPIYDIVLGIVKEYAALDPKSQEVVRGFAKNLISAIIKKAED